MNASSPLKTLLQARQDRLYRLMMVATIVATVVSVAMTAANLTVAYRRKWSGMPQSVRAAAPQQPQRQYVARKDDRPKREFRVLNIQIFDWGFLSARAATAMAVGTFFWPLIFWGYRADRLARQAEEDDQGPTRASLSEASPPTPNPPG